MQNYWIPAAKIWQISSFYSRSWRDVDLLMKGRQMYSHSDNIRMTVYNTKREWKRSGISFETLHKTDELMSKLLITKTWTVFAQSCIRESSPSIKQQTYNMDYKIHTSFYFEFLFFPHPTSSSPPVTASLVLYQYMFLPEYINIWIFPFWGALL